MAFSSSWLGTWFTAFFSLSSSCTPTFNCRLTAAVVPCGGWQVNAPWVLSPLHAWYESHHAYHYMLQWMASQALCVLNTSHRWYD